MINKYFALKCFEIISVKNAIICKILKRTSASENKICLNYCSKMSKKINISSIRFLTCIFFFFTIL